MTWRTTKAASCSQTVPHAWLSASPPSATNNVSCFTRKYLEQWINTSTEQKQNLSHISWEVLACGKSVKRSILVLTGNTDLENRIGCLGGTYAFVPPSGKLSCSRGPNFTGTLANNEGFSPVEPFIMQPKQSRVPIPFRNLPWRWLLRTLECLGCHNASSARWVWAHQGRYLPVILKTEWVQGRNVKLHVLWVWRNLETTKGYSEGHEIILEIQLR